ncbi:MAG: lipoprotein [Tatlockia sp.]|nr:lipoprotein [Tatlockia sp.]
MRFLLNIIIISLTVATFSACGQKGPLYLPTPGKATKSKPLHQF